MRFLYSMICSLGIAAISGVCTTQAAEVADINFTYATPYAVPATPIGTGRKNMHYDVAIHLSNPALAGYQVVGINVPIPATGGECYPEATAWLSSALTLEEEIFHPDITSAEGLIENFGTEEEPDYQIHINFDNPYTLTEEGVFVGYTVMVKDLKSWTAKYPVAVVEGKDAPGSLWVHCPKVDSSLNLRYLVWTDAYTSLNLSSAMTVILRGPKGDYIASISPDGPIAVETGSTTLLPAIISNFGSAPISSFSYSVYNPDSDREPYTASYTFNTPIPANFGASASVNLTVPSEPEQSDCNLRIAIDKVNGHDNEAAINWGEFLLLTRDRLPVRRPLIEELTGTWCKYCPEAYVMIKQLHDIYPHDEAPTIAVHTGDAMTTIKPTPFPTGATAPSIIIDRVNRVYNFNNLQAEWEARRRELCPVDLKVDLYWDDEAKTILRPVATANFVYTDPDTKYLLSYALVEDGMSNPSWKQTSDYDGFASKEGPYWDLFKTGPQISGLVFDEIALAMPSLNGIEDSLPADIVPDKDYIHYALFDPEECVNNDIGNPVAGKPVMQNPDNLRVIAYVVNPDTGEVYNSASSGYAADAPVYSTVGVSCPDQVVAEPLFTEFFSLSGVRLSKAPAGEPYIVVNHYEDGSVKSAKHLQ